MTKKQRQSRENGLMILWAMSKANEAEDEYAKVLRRYCLCDAKWEDVENARKNAHYYGVSDDRLIEIDIDVQSSITDEELYKAVFGA